MAMRSVLWRSNGGHRMAPWKARNVVRRNKADQATKPGHGMAASGSRARQPDPREEERQYGSMLLFILAIHLMVAARTIDDRINDTKAIIKMMTAVLIVKRNEVDLDMW